MARAREERCRAGRARGGGGGAGRSVGALVGRATGDGIWIETSVLLTATLSRSAPISGLNGFNVLLPGSRNPQAGGAPSGQLPPLGIPCMVLPSPTLGPFPVLYSPTVPRPVSSAAGALPGAGPVHFGVPSLGSTAHLLIGPTNVVNPKSSTLPSADPQLQRPRSLGLSPEVPGPHGIVQPGSPGCTAHPGSAVKPQQVSRALSPGGPSFCDLGGPRVPSVAVNAVAVEQTPEVTVARFPACPVKHEGPSGGCCALETKLLFSCQSVP